MLYDKASSSSPSFRGGATCFIQKQISGLQKRKLSEKSVRFSNVTARFADASFIAKESSGWGTFRDAPSPPANSPGMLRRRLTLCFRIESREGAVLETAHSKKRTWTFKNVISSRQKGGTEKDYNKKRKTWNRRASETNGQQRTHTCEIVAQRMPARYPPAKLTPSCVFLEHSSLGMGTTLRYREATMFSKDTNFMTAGGGEEIQSPLTAVGEGGKWIDVSPIALLKVRQK